MIPSSSPALWQPDLPAGELRAITLHWTAGGYGDTFDAYHFCVTGAQAVEIHATRDLRENMRDVRAQPDQPYAAHVAGRNAWNAGIAAAAMRGAEPHDFGSAPITAAQINGMCVVAARLAAFYAIPLAAIRTHAEIAFDDGYFGARDDEVRWDMARIAASDAALTADEAVATGAGLRARIAALMQNGGAHG